MPLETIRFHLTDDDFMTLSDECVDSMMGSCHGDEEGLEVAIQIEVPEDVCQ